MNDAIIISDIHLGSEVTEAKTLISFLTKIENKTIDTKKLIINGDLFDSWDFRKLKKTHWRVLSHIRKLSKRVHVVWINGNHDGPAEIISHLIGVEFFEEYKLKSGNKTILILHGDVFDNFIVKYPLLTKLADKIYRFIQKIDKSFYLAKMAKRNSKTFLRCSEQIKNKAINYCKKKGCHMVCCGHTHFAESGDTYFNSGCWTESPSGYLTVLNGDVFLNFFNQSEIDQNLSF